IGATIQEKVLALADDGAIPAAVKLRAKFPPGLLEITRLPGLGPKRARRLFDELGIDSLDALRAAATEQRIRALKGFGPKAEESMPPPPPRPGSGCGPTLLFKSTFGSWRPISSAICCSTSPAPSSTTWRCATWRCARDFTSPSTACSTTPPARLIAARRRHRS